MRRIPQHEFKLIEGSKNEDDETENSEEGEDEKSAEKKVDKKEVVNTDGGNKNTPYVYIHLHTKSSLAKSKNQNVDHDSTKMMARGHQILDEKHLEYLTNLSEPKQVNLGPQFRAFTDQIEAGHDNEELQNAFKEFAIQDEKDQIQDR